MTSKSLITMMEHRQVSGLADPSEVQRLAQRFPWCSTFQVLNAISLKEQDDLAFKAQFYRAAIAIYDRSRLFEYFVKDVAYQHTASIDLFDEKDESEVPSELPNLEIEEKGTPLPEKNSPFQAEETHNEKAETAFISQDRSINKDLLPTAPMESEIMREAAKQLGELEAQIGLENRSDKLSDLELQQSFRKMRTEKYDGQSAFVSWLQIIDNQNFNKHQNITLIDKFLKDAPKISPAKASFFSPSHMGKKSLVEDLEFVTETLAKIYEKQGEFAKAIKAYENLALKNPGKRLYFAALKNDAEAKLKNG